MDAFHARYPFLAAAREAVEAADVDLGEVAVGGGPVVERALERVRSAIESGTVGEPHRSPRVELLSYPVARVLVSLVDEPGLVRRYAVAEAETAYRRFEEDAEGEPTLRSVDRDRMTLDRLLREFDLAGSVTEAETGFRVDVATYLELAGDLGDDRWRLVHRALDDGAVTATPGEVDDLLREAIRGRVESGLPLDVPDPVAEALDPAAGELRSSLAEVDLDIDIDAVVPELFPPCVAALLDRLRGGEPLPDHSRFSLLSFLASIGMDADEIEARFAAHPDLDGSLAREGLDYLRDDSVVYPPPSCATMQAYGDCVNMDELCETIAHPITYYERRLEGDDDVLQASRPESQ